MDNLPYGLGTIKDIIKRFSEAKRTWEQWRSLHQEAMDFAAPQRSTFHTFAPGQRKNRHIFDSTAVIGLEKFVNRIQSSVMPSWVEWMELTAGSEVPEDEKDAAQEGLEKLTELFFKNLNHSNFSTEIAPALSDLGIGTGAIMIEEGTFAQEELFKFTNIPLAELYIEDLKNVWRDQEIEVGKIKTSWPNADLPSEIETMIKQDPLKKIKLINGMVYNLEDQTYYQLVILEKKQKLIFMQPFKTQRLIVFRWHVTPGEKYGRGPILQMLADIRTLNKVKQFILENAAIQMVGMYTAVNDGIFNPNTARLRPGTILPVAQNGTQNPTIQALPRSGDIGIGGIVLEDLQENVKKALFIDPLGDITDPVRTATEIMIRNQDMLKQSGASLGRLKSELIEPLVAACVEILRTRSSEDTELKVDGKMISIKQTSPIAKAEEQEDFQNSQVWFSSIMQLGELLGPEAIMGTVKIEELPRYWAEKLGVPIDLVRDETERQQIADVAMQAAQAGMGGGGGQEQPAAQQQ